MHSVCYCEHRGALFSILFLLFNVFISREECKFYDQLEQIILKDRTSDDQDISELESITDSDSGISLKIGHANFFLFFSNKSKYRPRLH